MTAKPRKKYKLRSDAGVSRGAHGPYGPQSRTNELLPQYAALFAQRTADGASLTLAEVGRIMGVTRENVRIVRNKYFPDLDSKAVERKAQTQERCARRRFASPFLFRKLVRQWLAAEGYFYCGLCRTVKCEAQKTKGNNPRRARCKRCTADGTKAWRRRQSARAKTDAQCAVTKVLPCVTL